MCAGGLSRRLEDMNTNDYIFSIIGEQRRQDFIAEAANDRLAKLATADRMPWWRRAGQALIPVRHQVLTPRHSTR
jgi:hypothetical protein